MKEPMSEHFDLSAALQVARRRAWIVLLAVAVGVTAAWSVTRLFPRRYEATATLFVGSNAPGVNVATDIQYASLAQSLVTSYAELAESKRVAREAARAAGLEPSQVVGHVGAEAQPGVQILKLTASARSGALAARVANALAQALASRIESLSGSSGTHVGVQVIDDATPSLRPVSPRPLLNLIVGGLAGLLAGIALALGRERLDQRIRTVADAERELGLPVLGVIPKLPRRVRRADAIVRQANPTVAEPFRNLAVTLASIARRSGHRCILITSAGTKEGKSMVAAQLAVASAEDNQRVALIEGDLRRPSLGRQFQSTDPRGANVTLIAASGTESDAGRLVRTPQIERTLKKALRENDFVLLDAPPALVVADTSILARHADAVLLVVRANETAADDARAVIVALKRLDVEVIGVVLVAAHVPRRRRYYAGGSDTLGSIRQLKSIHQQTKAQVREQ